MDIRTKKELNSCLVMLIAFLFVAFITAIVIYFGWNYLAPIFWKDAFELTFWQSFGIGLVLRLLFGLFR